MTMAISCRAVSFALGGHAILRDVDVTVGTGEWVGLIGPNGAGKTSLLRAIAGSASADGRIILLGDDATDLNRRDMARRVALVPQMPELPGGMKVFDYVLLGRTPYVGYLGTERRGDLVIVNEALEALDLVGFAGRNVATLSGGEAQRVVLARAVAQQAPILLLDEPTTSLDVGRQQDVLELVEQLRHQRGLTVVSALHDLTLAGQYADRLILLDRGSVAADGPPAQVLAPTIVRQHFGADVRVIDTADGFVVVPVRAGTRRNDARSPAAAG